MSRRPLGPPVEEDVRRELRFHLEMRARNLREQGMDAEDARREALAAFGDYDRIAGECRHLSSNPPGSPRRMIESIAQDTRFALRSLQRAPGFVFLAVLTLALGIGANTAIFSVVRGVLLTPLPYPEGGRLVKISEGREDGGPTFSSARNFLDWRASADSFSAMALYPSYAFSAPATVLGGTVPTRAWIAGVTAGFFDALGVEPARGRSFATEEWLSDGAPAVVVSHGFWETVLGGDPDLAGLELRAYGAAVPVVGVMPAGFTFPEDTDIWWPMDATGMSSSRTSHGNEVIARLAEDATLESAQAELNAIHAGILAADPEDAQHPGVVVRALHEELYGSAQRPLLLLLGAAGLVLLMACTNLASGLLARGASRDRELAIRASLGAHRQRIVRQLFTESLLLGLVGAAAGILTGSLAVRALVAAAPGSVPRSEVLGVDGLVMGFALAVSIVTTLLFGLLPALKLSRGNMGAALRSGNRGNADDGRGRLWSWLVGAEVALAVLLLVGSGLLLRSFREVLGTDAGFDPAGVMTVDLSLPADLYPTNDDLAAPMSRILDEIDSIPGVRAVGAVNNLPLSGVSLNGGFLIEGRPEDEGGYSDYRAASAGYFAAMGIPLLRGRTFAASDDANAPHVAIINRAAADRFWPGEDPLGQTISGLANDSWVYEQPATIVGIVGNVRHRDLVREPSPEVYVHSLQRPMRLRSAIVAVRSGGQSTDLAAAVRERIATIDDQIPLALSTMSERVGRSLTERSFVLAVTAIFSTVALILAVIGIYGVVSYSTSRRTRELGIRMALGAEPGSVRRLVIRDALSLVVAGLVVGLVGALAIGQVLESMLYGVRPADPLTFAAVVVLLVAAAWLASVIPAWRGARVDPMITMRGD